MYRQSQRELTPLTQAYDRATPGFESMLAVINRETQRIEQNRAAATERAAAMAELEAKQNHEFQKIVFNAQVDLQKDSAVDAMRRQRDMEQLTNRDYVAAEGYRTAVLAEAGITSLDRAKFDLDQRKAFALKQENAARSQNTLSRDFIQRYGKAFTMGVGGITSPEIIVLPTADGGTVERAYLNGQEISLPQYESTLQDYQAAAETIEKARELQASRDLRAESTVLGNSRFIGANEIGLHIDRMLAGDTEIIQQWRDGMFAFNTGVSRGTTAEQQTYDTISASHSRLMSFMDKDEYIGPLYEHGWFGKKTPKQSPINAAETATAIQERLRNRLAFLNSVEGSNRNERAIEEHQIAIDAVDQLLDQYSRVRNKRTGLELYINPYFTAETELKDVLLTQKEYEAELAKRLRNEQQSEQELTNTHATQASSGVQVLGAPMN